MSPVLLIVGPEPLLPHLPAALVRRGMRVTRTSALGPAERALAHELPDLVMLDLESQGPAGLEWLQSLARRPQAPGLLLLLPPGNGELADGQGGLGPWDCVHQPIPGLPVMVHAVERAWERVQLTRARGAPRPGPAPAPMAEAPPAAERDRLRLAIEQVTDAVMLTDPDGTINYVNRAFTEVTGYPAEEVLGRTPAMLKSGQHAPAFYEEMWRTIRCGKPWRGQVVNRRKDGSLQTVEAHLSPVTDATGRIIQYVAVQRDISRHLELEARLVQAQKLEAVGTLAGGIAHDFNNILCGAIGFAQVAVEEAAGQPFLLELLQHVQDSHQRAADLVRQLLVFSRRERKEKQAVSVARLIEETLPLWRRMIPAQVVVETTLDPATPAVWADPAQVYQVVFNLFSNAQHALAGQPGRIGLQVVEARPDPDLARAWQMTDDGPCVKLAVRDSGAGLSAEARERIFEPYFTAKAFGQGAGLGLSLVHGIVKSHGGAIQVLSAPGEGTTFEVFLPVAKTPAREPDGSNPAAPGLRQAAREVFPEG